MEYLSNVHAELLHLYDKNIIDGVVARILKVNQHLVENKNGEILLHDPLPRVIRENVEEIGEVGNNLQNLFLDEWKSPSEKGSYSKKWPTSEITFAFNRPKPTLDYYNNRRDKYYSDEYYFGIYECDLEYGEYSGPWKEDY